MNKKIKVIELFKRIEKHEDIPQNIKYKDNCYTFKHTNYSIDHLYELKESCIGWLEHKDINLFEEVEILEDNTEEIILTEKIFVPMELNLADYDKNLINNCFESQNALINQIVRAVNKLRKEKEQMGCSGITHCEICGKPLDYNEYCICKECEKESEDKQ